MAVSATSPAHEKFNTVRSELSAGLIERDDEVALLLTAMAAGEHALLVSPPGCAKSLLVDSLVGTVDGPTFSILLTKFTAPEEVMGPLSLSALKSDRYARITTNRLPEACCAYLDEIWKSSSAVLNTLLRILNEGVYENDGQWVKSPLRFCVAASNEWPNPDNGGVELGALFDRFTFRKTVRPVRTTKGKDRLLFGEVPSVLTRTKLSLSEIDEARAEASSVVWSDESKDALREVLSSLEKDGVVPSDRRKRKSVRAAMASAWMAGSPVVTPDHLECLADVLWDDPVEQPVKVASVVARVCNPVGLSVSNLLTEAESVLSGGGLDDLVIASTAVTKLKDIVKKLRGLGPDARAVAAKQYVQGSIDQIVGRTMGH